MAKMMYATTGFDTLRREVWYSEARLLAELKTVALAARCAEWLRRISEAEKLFERVEKQEVLIDAARVGANVALDLAVTAFGDALLAAVGKDRKSTRWLGFFKESVSRFNDGPLSDQAGTVKGWLAASSDPVLLAHRPALEAALTRVDEAIARDQAQETWRGNLHVERDTLASWLTAQRDALEEELSALARADGLPRDWPASFFRVSKKKEEEPK